MLWEDFWPVIASSTSCQSTYFLASDMRTFIPAYLAVSAHIAKSGLQSTRISSGGLKREISFPQTIKDDEIRRIRKQTEVGLSPWSTLWSVRSAFITKFMTTTTTVVILETIAQN